MARRWTKEAEKALMGGVGFFGGEWFRKQGGQPYDYPNAPKVRSSAAVYAKARRLFGAGGLTRGSYTLARLAKETGYGRAQIRRAQSALNQKWKRLGPRGAHLITDEQAGDIIEWLKHDFWCKALRLYSCSWCGLSAKPHKGAGLCGACYFQHRRECQLRGVPTALAEQVVFLSDKSLDSCLPGEARFVRRAVNRLRAGKALSLDDLDWLVTVVGARC
jgi:hypothetical protein